MAHAEGRNDEGPKNDARRQVERELEDQSRLLAQLIETIPSPVFFKDEHGRYLGCNRANERVTGIKREDFIGKTVYDIWPRDLAEIYHAADLELFNTRGVQVYESQLLYADGSRHDVLFHRATFLKADGRLGGLVGVLWDVTERNLAERALRESEDRFRKIAESAPFGIGVTDEHGKVVFVNQKYQEIFRFKPEENTNVDDWAARVCPDEKARRRLVAARKEDNRRLRAGETSRSPTREYRLTCGDSIIRDVEITRIIVGGLTFSVFNDVSERRRLEHALNDALRSQALHDPLTKLFNRRYLDDALEREINRAQRAQLSLAVVMADVDHFKRVNDTFGHDCGDEVLRSIAKVLSSHFRKSDIVCRYGGEEFTILLPGTSTVDAVRRIEAVRGSIPSISITCRGQSIGPVTLSFGISVFPDAGHAAGVLLRAADEALLRAKDAGRNCVMAAIVE